MKMKILRFSGIITLLIYSLFTLLSITYNPWFSVMHNALSDLGATKANEPWIYNYGLILSAPFLLSFSLHLTHQAKNKTETVGGAFLSISSLFLAFIGIFHSGTEPHGFVSTYFFLQFFLGMFIWGIGNGGFMRKICCLLFISSITGAFFPWPSTALLEIYEIAIIATFVVLLYAENFHKN